MKITTQTFHYNLKELKRVALLDSYRRLWWYSVGIFLFGIILAFGPSQAGPIGLGLAVAGVIVPSIRVLTTYGSARNIAYFREPRKFVFTPKDFEAHISGKRVNRMPYGNLSFAGAESTGFRLHISRMHYFYVPNAAFASEQDRQEVETWLRATGKLR